MADDDDDDDKTKPPTYDEQEAEIIVLRATVARLSGEVAKRDEQIASLRKTPKVGLKLDPKATDRFRRPVGKR